MLSRRGILGLFGVAALPIAVEAKPQAPKQSFLKGDVLPRIHEYVVPVYSHGLSGAHTHGLADPCHSHSYTAARAVREVEYEIFDGSKFVPLTSEAGQRVVAELL